MELKALRLFVALADELHFGRAAKRVGVTQSVLSLQIKRLEDLVGAELFQRSTRQVRLTDVGIELRNQADGALRRVDEAIAAARARASGQGRAIRMGLTSAVLVSSIMDSIAAFRLSKPETHIVMREMGTVDQEMAIANGDLDIGILHPPLEHTTLTIRPILQERLVAAFNPHFFEIEKSPMWEALISHPIVFYQRRRAPRFYADLLRSADNAGGAPSIVAEAASFFAAAAMAQAGLGIAFLPQSIAALHNGMTTFDLPEGRELTLETAIAFPASMAQDPTIRALTVALPRA
ncbi:MAG: LysR family transcriptional regulator [Pseudomonadota bacterium]